MADLGPVGKTIVQKLNDALAPDHLEVIDESHLHRGHAGASPAGESHFRVRIRASSLLGLTRLAQHRAIHAALAAELAGRVHALAIEVIPAGKEAG